MTIRPRFHAAVAILTSAITLAIAPRDAGADGPRVLFIASSPTPFAARMRAEIAAMGFEIDPTSILVEDGTTTAVAAARVIESPPRRVELWISDTSTGKLTLRAFVMPASEDDEPIQTVRASEQLRAFFQRLREPTPSPTPTLVSAPAPPAPASEPLPSPVVAPAPAATPPPAATPARFVVGADLMVPFQSGGPGVNLAIRGRWMATDLLGVGAFIGVPLAGSTVKSTEGSASISATLFGASLSFVKDVVPRLRLSTTASLALAWVRTQGFAVAPYHGQPSNIAVALALLGAEIAPRLTDRTHLCFGGQLGASLPRADIAFAGRPVATWGRPLGTLSAGASVDW